MMPKASGSKAERKQGFRLISERKRKTKAVIRQSGEAG